MGNQPPQIRRRRQRYILRQYWQVKCVTSVGNESFEIGFTDSADGIDIRYTDGEPNIRQLMEGHSPDEQSYLVK